MRPAKVKAAVSGRRVIRFLAPALVAVAFFAFGLAVAAVGGRLGPAIMLGVPLTMMAMAAIAARPILGVVAVYASLPLSEMDLPTAAFGLQAVEVAVVLATGAVIAGRVATGQPPLAWSAPMWGPLLVLAWLVLAAASAADLSLAMRQVAQAAAAFLFALVVLSATRSMEDVRLALGALLLVGAGIALFGLQDAGTVRVEYGGARGVNRAEGLLTHPNHLGSFAGTLFLVAIGWSLSVYGFRRVIGVVSAIVAAIALTMSLSRGAWIGTVAAGVLMLWLLPQARRTLVLVGVPLLASGVLTIALFGSPDVPQVDVVRQRLSTLAKPASPLDSRPAIYREALRQIRDDPWTGEGPGNFPIASAQAASPARTVGALHAHNVLLTLASEAGIPAAVLLVAFTLMLGRTVVAAARHLSDPKHRALIAGVGSGLFVHVGQGLIDFNLRQAVILFVAASLVGMVLVARRALIEEGRLAEAVDYERRALETGR